MVLTDEQKARIRASRDPSPFIMLETKRMAQHGTVILRYNGKHDPLYWNVTTPKQEEKAIRALFEMLNEMAFYYELGDDVAARGEPSSFNGCAHTCVHHEPVSEKTAEKERIAKERILYEKAKTGDVKAMAALLEWRKDGEYEGWFLERVED